jgi:WD40 repeat protein
LVLERSSSTFKIDGEIIEALKADHHQVCKYVSIEDENYVTVKTVLRNFVNQYHIKDFERRQFLRTYELLEVQNLLGISTFPEDDQEEFHRHYMPGSCHKFMTSSTFQNWVDGFSGGPFTMWVNGPSGVGKTVLASHIIHHLKDRGLACQFFYFRSEDQWKRSVDHLFKSLLYQIAKDNARFRTSLASLSRNRERHRMRNASNLWRVLQHNLFDLPLTEPRHWIIDGIDQCNTPAVLLRSLDPLFASATPIRIILLSRRTNVLESSFKELVPHNQFCEFRMRADYDDLFKYVRESVKKIRLDPDLLSFRQKIEERVVKSAEGNFLWTRLVIERLLQCRGRTEVEAALEELPPQLEYLYRRMEDALCIPLTHSDEIAVTKTILIWATCYREPLTLEILSRALGPNINSVLDLPSYIDRVCGGFVVVDRRASQVTIVHHSAQYYLTQRSENLGTGMSKAHAVLFDKCMQVLLELDNDFLRQDISLEVQLERDRFLQYAATFWFHHLLESEATSLENTLHLLANFLGGRCNLMWIAILASGHRLQSITEAAEALDSFLMQHQRRFTLEDSATSSFLESARTVHRWAIDLRQITAKFGDHLASNPLAIFHQIQPFCPVESAICKSARSTVAADQYIAVTGISGTDWDDCLARFPMRQGCNASRILCMDEYFAVSTSTRGPNMDGSVILYRTGTLEETQTLAHGEPVDIMEFSASSRLIAMSSRGTINVWTMPMDPAGNAQVLCTIRNTWRSQLLALAFTSDDQSIMTCSYDGLIRMHSLGSLVTDWTIIGFVGGRGKPPNCAAFNHDASLLAVGYRGAPMEIWELNPFRLLQEHQRRCHIWTGVTRIEWNLASGHVVGIYDDGCVFKWSVATTGQVDETPAGAINIKCNIAGDIFVTSSGDSKLTVWDFQHFRSVYQLSLPVGTVDLAIDPDGRRIYELRESRCTIWQPISLVRRCGSSRCQTDNLDTTLGFVHAASPVNEVVTIPADITALAVSHKSTAYCAGNMNGVLEFGNAESGSFFIPPSFKSPIELLAWSWDDKYIAIAEIGNSISVKVAELATRAEGEILHEKLPSPAKQLLFNNASNKLFVVTSQFLYVWAIERYPRLVSRRPVRRQCRWVNHPSNSDLLLGFAFDTLLVIRWRDLLDEYQVNILPPVSYAVKHGPIGPSRRNESDTTPSIYKVFVSFDASIAFLQTSSVLLANGANDEFFMLYDLEQIWSMADSSGQISLTPLPRHLQALIHTPLGFLHAKINGEGLYSSIPVMGICQAQLVFLSNEGWMSAMYLGGGDVTERVKNYYFLPTNWLVEDATRLAQINHSGTFFCPKNGQIGIVRCKGLLDN